MSFISLRSINKYYGDFKVLDNINLDFSLNEIVFIVGKSGCGKTTLLNTIGLIDDDFEGKITVNNKTVNSKNSSKFRYKFYSYVFQNDNLIDYLNCKENILFASKNKSEKDIENLAEKLGVKEIIDKPPTTLSMGERQRIALVRCLCNFPKVIIADEPTGSLDEENAKIFMDMLKENSKSKLMIIATHDIEMAKQYGTRILYFTNNGIEEEILNNENVLISEAADIDKRNISKTNIFKRCFHYLRNNMKLSLLMVLLVSIITLIINIFLGFYDGISQLTDYELNNRLDSRYYTIESVEEGLSVTDSSVFLPLKKNNIDYLEYNNFTYLFDSHFKSEITKQNNIDFKYEISVIDFSFFPSLNTKVVVNNEFKQKYSCDNIIFKGSYDFLDCSLTFNLSLDCDNITYESTLFNNPKIYIDYDYCKSLFTNEQIEYIFNEQYEHSFPKYIFTLSSIEATNKVLNEAGYINYSTSNNTENSYIYYYSSNLILSESLKDLLKSISLIFIGIAVLLTFSVISLCSILISYSFDKRKREMGILYCFGLNKQELVREIYTYCSILIFIPYVISIILYYVFSAFSTNLNPLILGYNSSYILCPFEPISIITTTFIAFLIINISVFVSSKNIMHFNYTEVFKNE